MPTSRPEPSAKSDHGTPVRASSAKRRASCTGRKTRAAHSSPGMRVSSFQMVRPRVASVLLCSSVRSRSGSNDQRSSPVSASRAMARLKGVTT